MSCYNALDGDSNMKYAIAYKEDYKDPKYYSNTYQWIFLSWISDANPFGVYCRGMKTFDLQEDAVKYLAKILDTPYKGVNLNFDSEKKLNEFKKKLTIVSIPDEALAKWQEVRDLINWCDDNPTTDIPKGCHNSLSHKSDELERISREGNAIFQAHLSKNFP